MILTALSHFHPPSLMMCPMVSPDWSYGLGYLTNNAGVAKMHQTDGSDFQTNGSIVSAGYVPQPLNRINITKRWFGNAIYTRQNSGHFHQPCICQPCILDSDGQNMYSNLHPAFRGYLPGMFQSLIHWVLWFTFYH